MLVRCGDPDALAHGLRERGATVTQQGDAGLHVEGLEAAQIGELAFHAGVILHELTPQRASLEDVFMELTADSVEFGHQEGAGS